MTDTRVTLFGSALSTPYRVELLRLLLAAPRSSIASLAEVTRQRLQHTAHHVTLLRAFHVVEVVQDGRSKYVSVRPELEQVLTVVLDTFDALEGETDERGIADDAGG